MERLTKRLSNGVVRTDVMGDSLMLRCAAYEDTGLTPSEVSDGKKCGSNTIKIVREIVGKELDVRKGLINGNSGLFNSGNMNSGNMNSGNMNSGNMNSGNMNSGYRNSGNRNSGNRNSGYRNSGNMNSGDMNSGVFNKCDFSNGVFCTTTPDIMIFNQPSGMNLRDFYNSKYWDAMCSSPFLLTEWIGYTEDEMKGDPAKEARRGYLKVHEYKDACAHWWNSMSENNRKIIMEMPNFDAEIFKEITGIDVEASNE